MANAGDAQMANLTWQTRWNKVDQISSLSQSAADVMGVGWFGIIRFRLDRQEDVAALVAQTRGFADSVERLSREWASLPEEWKA